MLVNKGYAAGDIVGFKLVNGDEIVAKVVETLEDGYLVSKPLTLVPSHKGIGLVQSMFSADINSSITLNKSSIIMHNPAFKDMEDHYLQTTTGIQPVTNGGIIT